MAVMIQYTIMLVDVLKASDRFNSDTLPHMSAEISLITDFLASYLIGTLILQESQCINGTSGDDCVLKNENGAYLYVNLVCFTFKVMITTNYINFVRKLKEEVNNYLKRGSGGL